ncbi:MAG: hypothetical protein ACI837_000433 [Crocinitomicaceae bacterium]|jgi:hypothetical protein
MIRKLLLSAACALTTLASSAQCDSTTIPSDYTLASDLIMSGTYFINGTFTVPAAFTVTITPYSSNSCGELKIYADNIVIDGVINGDFAGYVGGTGGARGTIVGSSTGHTASLASCDDPDNEGNITVEAGFGGLDGNGPGAGQGGADGQDGSGSKQWCGNTADEAGVIGGAGGAGGGSGGSYGGAGSIGADGGDGSSGAVTNNLIIEGTYPIVGGSGGSGGASTAVVGTDAARDIDLGSGGAGSGGGGRSFNNGTAGALGGTGGAVVLLHGTLSVDVTGTISVIGENGGNGGNGGDGDATADCCSDLCNGCDERTFTSGSGAGSGAGGGSGGGIFIESLGTADVSGNLNVDGGDGGAKGSNGAGVTCVYTDFVCGDQDISTGNASGGNSGGAGGGGRIKIYVLDCVNANLNPVIGVAAGIGNGTAGIGTYEEVCGYAGLSKPELSIGWVIYPNPASTTLNIEFHSGLNFESENRLEMYNNLGQVVYSTDQLKPEMNVDLNNFDSGIYMVRIVTATGTEIKKIVKK